MCCLELSFTFNDFQSYGALPYLEVTGSKLATLKYDVSNTKYDSKTWVQTKLHDTELGIQDLDVKDEMVRTCRAQHSLDSRSTQAVCGCTEKT